MAYDEALVERVRAVLLQRPEVVEKKMFGGVAFLLHGRMFCGIVQGDLMVRVGPDRYDEALGRAHVRPMDFTGRPMRGYVFIAPAGRRTARALAQWVDQGAAVVAALPAPTRTRIRRAPRARRVRPAR